ncbi:MULTISPECIES: glutaredoxin family protein [Cyanophyceae]|uniref:glutaredoxin family protein n=1 Tax=Cyanophyceae TaxID=3028117 RepID=UPI0028C39CB4|nr:MULTISPECIES: glutaredoxin family protein [unclassified Phormidium]
MTDPVTKFVLYSKPGCHLCEGLEEKLVVAAHLPFELEVRDITTRDDWFQRYQYEIPVLCCVRDGDSDPQEIPLPRLSPRAPQAKVEQLIQTYMGQSKAE